MVNMRGMLVRGENCGNADLLFYLSCFDEVF